MLPRVTPPQAKIQRIQYKLRKYTKVRLETLRVDFANLKIPILPKDH